MSITIDFDDSDLGDNDEAEALASSLAGKMASSWQRGHRLTVEELLARHPDISKSPEAAVRLIYEEVVLRREAGEAVDDAELLARFPRWHAELAMLLACDRLIEPDDLATGPVSRQGTPDWPRVGTRIGGFLLLQNLGSGSMGRTFLASDPDLADRPVVLKLTPRGLGEHVSLARIQHTNVVPLYAAPEYPDRDLRALCMPYLGGTSLDRVFKEISRDRENRPTGLSIVDAVDRVQAKAPVKVKSDGPARRLLRQLPYPEAIAWIAACLADALHDAHDRGLIHMDVKPANVLIAADGTPMLLDFHLARAPISPESLPPTWLGGTPGTMAPEQRAAMEAVKGQALVMVGVDGRVDIYGLGRLMEEAFAVPRGQEGVSVGLRSIVARCLEPNPNDRYRNAASLAADLRRHLNDQPLQGVPNRSLVERWTKWRRRSPQSLSRSVLVAIGLGGLLAFGFEAQRRFDRAETMLDEARRQFLHGHYEVASNDAEGALGLLSPWPGVSMLRESITGLRDQARRARLASELHAVVESLRFVCGAGAPPSRLAPLRAGLPAIRKAWETGRLLANPAEFPMAPALARQAHDDLRDLALLGPELELKLATVDSARRQSHEHALLWLVDAEGLLGPSRAFADARVSHARALGLAEVAREAAEEAEAYPPATAADYHAIGLARLQAGDDLGALDGFDRAIDLDPHDFWPTFHRAMTAYRLGRHADALADFHACIALSPLSADCYYNRALAHAALGHLDRAVRDDIRALELDPKLAEAALNVGLHHYGLKHYEAAETALLRALALGADPELVHYNLGLVRYAQANRQGAIDALGNALRLPQARTLRDRLLKESGR